MNDRKQRIVAYLIASAFAVSLLAPGSLFLAEAALIEPEQHWKYSVDSWKWDSDIGRNHGIIVPQVVIQNETASRIDGYIADSMGTRLDFYNGAQVVMAKFGYDNGGASEWEMADIIEGGNFTVEIPSAHKEADNVQLYIGNNQYTVNDGTFTTPQTWVFVNSVRSDYALNATIQQPETVIAEETQAAWTEYSSDSLIDRIMRMYSLSIGSADTGK